MEASTLQPSASLARSRVALGSPLLRFRSDEQLVELFRAGSDEAFRAIHDRYHKRLFAYARQMLPGRQDAEDALQDVFVRAYSGLRTSDRELALRAWLFRIAHNRCVDELRKPAPPPPEVLQLVRSTVHDPLFELDLRESLRRLVEDIRRLPDQQRSALLMRELAGMSYAELSSSLAISVGAVKSLLVRARIALAEAAQARDTACSLIREQLVEAHDRGVRPNANARKHMRDCVGCKAFRRELRGVSRQLAATAPTLGPLGFLAQLLGLSGGAGGGAAGGAGGAALFGGGGATASVGGVALGANHVATLLIAAAATAGGAAEIQRTILHQSHPVTVRATPVHRIHPTDAAGLPYRAVRDVETHGMPGVISAIKPARAKPTASGTSTSTKTTTLRHSRHAEGAAGLKKVTAKVPTSALTVGGDLPSSSTTTPSTTTIAGTGLSASCPSAAAPSAPGAQSAASGTAPATANPGGGTPAAADSPASTTPPPCGSGAGSSPQTPASSDGSSTPAGSTTSSSTTSMSTGSGSNAATGSGSAQATSSGSDATTGSGSPPAPGSSSGASTSGSSSGTTTR